MKMNNFIPYPDKVLIQPYEADSILMSDENKRYLAKGKVLKVGTKCTFLKVGDIVFYEPYGQFESTKDENGNQHFVVPERSEFILGKYSIKDARKKQRV